MVLIRIILPMTIYNIAMSKLEELQRKITASLKKWLRIPKSFSKDCMYSKSSKLRLPFTSLEKEYKVAKARNYVTFKESNDPCIKHANISVDRGPKSDTPGEVKEAKERLRMKELTGIPNRGREGL